MSMKLDISKTYNRVEWHFIEQIIEKMGFDETWISKVMMCINSVSFRVLINGEPSDTICPSGGLLREEFVKRLRNSTPRKEEFVSGSIMLERWPSSTHQW